MVRIACKAGVETELVSGGVGRRLQAPPRRRLLETALLPAPFWCTKRVESAHFDWRSRERPALALLAWEAFRDPLMRLRRMQMESIGTTIIFRPRLSPITMKQGRPVIYG